MACFERQERYTAIALSAAMGEGKTVIATGAIELPLYGDESHESNPETTVLCITTTPASTSRPSARCSMGSSQLRPTQLQRSTRPWTSKRSTRTRLLCRHSTAGKGGTNYVRGGTEKRQRSLWDTIGDTIRGTPQDFRLVIDEAHRDMGARKTGQTTITSKPIDGTAGNFHRRL